MLLLQAMLSTNSITDLSDAANGVQASFHLAHFLPHGYETVAQVKEVAETALLRQMQAMLDESSAKMNRV